MSVEIQVQPDSLDRDRLLARRYTERLSGAHTKAMVGTFQRFFDSKFRQDVKK